MAATTWVSLYWFFFVVLYIRRVSKENEAKRKAQESAYNKLFKLIDDTHEQAGKCKS